MVSFDWISMSFEWFEELGVDICYFWWYMGFGWLGWFDCFIDFGLNFVLVWMVVGTLVSHLVWVGILVFRVFVNFDVGFYVLIFVLVWWVFGLWTVFVMVLWFNCVEINEVRFIGGFF